ncbi:MAG: hypothetical protein IPP68_00055 [Elusimicrobia bacterium]|nr:hypothetical protein [Elusimicrobiota bacterium]
MIAALVCGRKERLPFPGRNTFPLLGRPLMAYPLLAALNAAEKPRTYLSTDDEAMAGIARHLGAGVIERPAVLRAGDGTLEDVIAHGYREIARREGRAPEFLVVLLANAPTVTSGMIDQGLEQLRRDPTLDGVASVTLRNDFAPRYALRLEEGGVLKPFLDAPASATGAAYFSDSLMWVLRARLLEGESLPSTRPNEIVNPARQRVAPLVHEGYGDIDHVWQIPAVEEWLRRRGFSDVKTPYLGPAGTISAIDGIGSTEAVRRVPPERRVLVTTVPFCDVDRRPLEDLEKAGAAVFVNPLGRRLQEEDLIRLIPDFGLLVAGTEPITDRVLAAAPHLRLIARVGIGLDNVDLAAARRRNIRVTYTPDAPAPAVAELTVGLMLTVLRHIALADRQMRNGVWNRVMGRRLAELTVGVVGVGRVGRRVIRHLTGGFPGVRVLAQDLSPTTETLPGPVEWADLPTLLSRSDVLSLHVPLTPATRNLIDRRALARMKASAVIINTARGEVVNENDLAEALRSGALSGAAVDVFDREPYSGVLATLPRCVLTSHMGSMSQDCRVRMEREAVDEVLRFCRGEALSSVVPENEYPSAATAARKDVS